MKKVELFNGFTKSAWKSLVVKSIRIAWVEGMQEAAKNLSKSDMFAICAGQVFEDIFPRDEDLSYIAGLIRSGDWERFLMYDTHHGRGYTDAFCDYEHEACDEKSIQQCYSLSIPYRQRFGFVPPRVYNCFYTWHKINPTYAKERSLLHTSFVGMPECVLDGHTYEGVCAGTKHPQVWTIEWQKANQDRCLLSGYYGNHRLIGREVMKNGWGNIRKVFLAQKIIESKYKEQPKLF